MNTSHNAHDPEGNEREYALLETQLSSYFGAQPDEPLRMDSFWRRLAPHLETRVGAEQAAATATDTVQPDRVVATRHIADDALVTRTVSAPRLRPRRLAHVITNIASIGAVVALCLAAFAVFHVAGLGAPGQRGTPHAVKLNWQKARLPAGVVLIDGQGVTVTANGTPIAIGSATSFPTANAAYYVAPSNGNIAYICQYSGSHAPRIWRTANAGQDWTPLAAMPSQVRSPNALCEPMRTMRIRSSFISNAQAAARREALPRMRCWMAPRTGRRCSKTWFRSPVGATPITRSISRTRMSTLKARPQSNRSHT